MIGRVKGITGDSKETIQSAGLGSTVASEPARGELIAVGLGFCFVKLLPLLGACLVGGGGRVRWRGVKTCGSF